MASHSSPYLQAIQSIPGKIPSEKFRELGRIAKKIVSRVKSEGDTTALLTICITEVPEPLHSRVRLEIANLLRDYDGVIQAIKSEDCTLIDRALQMTWFFRGTNSKDVINVDYFHKHILPYVSLVTRLKLIKKLAVNLRASNETELGEKFYTYFTHQYSRDTAEPMLLACGESFIYDTAKNKELSLSIRTVKRLFVKYPQMIIRYLKLSNPEKYEKFIPSLIKNHLDAFTELIEMYDRTYHIVLRKKAIGIFLKNKFHVFINKAKLYIKMMPLKVVAAKLTKAQYKRMISKLLPDDVGKFSYESVRKYLEHFPESERMSLVIDSYREKYNENLLDNHDAIRYEFLEMLPIEERTRQARVKLEKNPDSMDQEGRWMVEKAWRCYLPISESYPSIKKEIAKTSMPEARSFLLIQMIHCCTINNWDKEALFGFLEYFTTRHRNESLDVIFEVLWHLIKYYDLVPLASKHWDIINDFIRFLEIKDALKHDPQLSCIIQSQSIHFDLIHDLPIDDKIEKMLEFNIQSNTYEWSIIKKYPEYDRLCYEKMLSMIPKKYPRDQKILDDSSSRTMMAGIVKWTYSLKTRIGEATSSELSIKNIPWLIDDVRDFVQSSKYVDSYIQQETKLILRNNEPDLYEAWIGNNVPHVDCPVIPSVWHLKKNPQDVLEKWERYLKEARSRIDISVKTKRFIKAARWYQDIPIRFLDQCLKELDDAAILILGILMEGSEFAGVIEPLLPQVSIIKTDAPDAKAKWVNVIAISKATSLANPPVPLNLVLRCCDGDYLNSDIPALTNACRRNSAAKIESFTKTLVDTRVSVRKHVIRSYFLVPSLDDQWEFLIYLSKTEKHYSIREIIFQKFYHLFTKVRFPKPWTVLKNFMNEFSDDYLCNLIELTHFVPDQCIHDFIQELFLIIEKREPNDRNVPGYVHRLLRCLNCAINDQFTEEYCQQLIEKYVFNPRFSVAFNITADLYVLNIYLIPAGARLESRLKFFCDLFENVLRQHWNFKDPECSKFYPMNHLVHVFVEQLVKFEIPSQSNDARVEIIEAVLRTLLKVLKLEQIFDTYILLTIGVALANVQRLEDSLDKIIETIRTLVERFPSEMLVEMACILKSRISFYVEPCMNSDEVENFFYGVIEGLCKSANKNDWTIAAKLLFRGDDRDRDDRYNKIVEMFCKSSYPAVRCLVHRHVRECDLRDKARE